MTPPSPAVLSYVKTDILLKIDHVSLTLGGRVILRDVDAQIQDIIRPDLITGQVICFLGPSGVGKSTLSRVIAGLQVPTAGRVMLEHDVPVRRGMVGFVPQNYPLFRFETVMGNLLIAGRMGGLPDREVTKRAVALLHEFDLASYASYYPKALSGGTRQRVAIIRQLMADRHVVVMDEPFSGLDPNMKQRAAELVVKVANRDEKNIIIVVTHDVTQGLSVADTCWLMGREEGLPGARLVEQYDLAAQDLCWHPEMLQDSRFQQFVGDVKARFAQLS